MYNKTKKGILFYVQILLNPRQTSRHNSDYSSNGEYFRYFSNLSA